MEILLVILRIVHVVAGVFWAGTIFFFVLLLEPSIRAAGPAGGAVMGQLIRKGYLNILPLVATLAIASGLWLFWIISGGLNAAWGHTPMGTALTVGGVAALVGYVVGVFRMRPKGLRMAVLGPQLAAAESEEEKARLGAEVAALQSGLRKDGRVVAVFLLVAVLGMAIARYI